MANKRNLLAGEAYENYIIEKFGQLKMFPELARSADINKKLDAKKLDIITENSKDAKNFKYAIQAKNTTKSVVYLPLLIKLQEERPDFMPIIFHRFTNKLPNTDPPQYLTALEVAITTQDHLIRLIEERERYKKSYAAVMQYWDSLSGKQQVELSEELRLIL